MRPMTAQVKNSTWRLDLENQVRLAMKRSRIEENRYDHVWARLVAKILYVVMRLTELAVSLMGQRIYVGTMDEETETEVNDMEDWEQIRPHGRNKFNIWPTETSSTRTRRSVENSVASDSVTPVSQTPPTASEEKSPGSYRPSTRSPNTPTELVEKPPEPKAFPKENSKKGKNLKGNEIVDEEDPETCEHHKTTKRGTNAFVNVEKCLKCGKILKSERKADLTEIKIKIEPGDQEEKPMMDKDKADFAEFLEYQKWKAERNRSQTGGNKK